MLAFKLQNYNQQLLLFGGDFAIGKLRVFVSFVAHDLNYLQELEILAFRSAFDREDNRSSSHYAHTSMSKNQSPSKNPKAFPYVPFLLGDVFVFYLISLMAGLESSNRFRLMSVLTSVFLFHSEGICNNRMVDELPN